MITMLVDCETTGLPGQEAEGKPPAELIEVAAALIDTEIPDGLIWAECFLRDPDSGNLAIDINHIEDGLLDQHNLTPSGGWDRLVEAAEKAEVIIAHDRDGTFDRGFISGCAPEMDTVRPWVNSRELKYPKGAGGRLDYIAVDHGIVPFGRWRHRALWDVLILADALYHVENLEAQIRDLLKPRACFKVVFPSGFDAELNTKAKAAGFWFDKPRKWWIRNLPSDTPTEPTEDRPFKIVNIGPPEKRSQ